MATLTVQTISRAGLNATNLAVAADAALSDKWANDGTTFLYINNGGGAPITLTLTLASTATVDGQLPSSRAVSVTNGKAFVVGPFPTSVYNDTNGFMNVSYSAVTSVTVCPFKLGS